MIPGAAVASGVAKLTSHAALAAGMTGMTRFAAEEAGTLTKLAVKEAEGVAEKTTTSVANDATKWIWGQDKGVAKSIRQMEQRGWGPEQVS